MPMNVLVVDDNRTLANTVSRIFKRNGHQVVVAYGVEEALDAAHSDNQFDLIVSDVMMQDGTGADLHRQLRPELGNKVVFHTGGMFDNDARNYVLATGLEVIVKTDNRRLLALARSGVR